MSKSREQIIEWLKRISIEGKDVLDIGAGDESKWAKNFVQGLAKSYKTCDLLGEHDFLMDLNKPYPAEFFAVHGQFDVVFCLETLEHVWNPVQAIENIGRFIKKGGILYLSVPFINPIHNTHDMLRFTDQWFEYALSDFDRLLITRRDATTGEGYLREFYRVEGMRMSKVTLAQGKAEQMYVIGWLVEAWK